MNDSEGNDRETLSEKLTTFLTTHRRIVDEFERSLKNAQYFLELAQRSMEREPEETVAMLEQIKEIDLLGHLSRQWEEYQNVAGFLKTPNPPLEDDGLLRQSKHIEGRYEELLRAAEAQLEEGDRLLFSLQNQA